MPGCGHGMLSVCRRGLSVTQVYCDKTTEVRMSGTRGFRLRDAISRKWCEIELRCQLITNRKLYVGFLLQQKLMTLNDLERQFTALSPEICELWPNG